jgi:drug/metabolite transporter (DMT)-like permease
MPARLAGFIYQLVTATGWALNWPAMKVLLREWPPLFSRGVAGLAAAVLPGLIAKFTGQDLRVSSWSTQSMKGVGNEHGTPAYRSKPRRR